MIDVFLKGCSVSRSESPVMIKSALPDKASSRYMSSLGSRQRVIRSLISTLVQSGINSSRNDCLISVETYRSNFGRIKTSISSANVALESSSVAEENLAFNRALPGTEVFDNSALTRILQSK